MASKVPREIFDVGDHADSDAVPQISRTVCWTRLCGVGEPMMGDALGRADRENWSQLDMLTAWTIREV